MKRNEQYEMGKTIAQVSAPIPVRKSNAPKVVSSDEGATRSMMKQVTITMIGSEKQ
jgi:hypothetical protein